VIAEIVAIGQRLHALSPQQVDSLVERSPARQTQSLGLPHLTIDQTRGECDSSLQTRHDVAYDGSCGASTGAGTDDRGGSSAEIRTRQGDAG
jgi:hypothetical protein